MPTVDHTHVAPPPAETSLQRIQQIHQKQRAFFNGHNTLSLDFREAQLKRLQRAVKQYEQELFEAMYTDFRKPELESFATEVGFVELELKLTLKHLRKWARRSSVKESLINFPARSYTYPDPYGLSLIMGPWNYPFQLLINPLVGAMAAGNCAILKPSELTPTTSAVIAAMIREHFDEAYIAAVEGGADTSQNLLRQPFDYIFFTGSSRVARFVMKAAAEHLTPLTLELGGKSPAIVAEDADLGLAARRITWGKFINAGQTCVAPDYVLVQEEVKEELVQQIRQSIKEFYGEDPALSPDYPRIVNDVHFHRLHKFLSNGVVRAGGQADEFERYIAPTLLDQVSFEHPVMQEEIFGPILPILTVSSMEEAMRIVNSQPKPLALYFFSSSKERQQRVLRCTHFGGGCINDTISHLINPHLPFGGVGASGMGSYHGKSSFELFSHRKSVVHRGTWLDLPLRYPPYHNRLHMLRKLFNWL